MNKFISLKTDGGRPMVVFNVDQLRSVQVSKPAGEFHPPHRLRITAIDGNIVEYDFEQQAEADRMMVEIAQQLTAPKLTPWGESLETPTDAQPLLDQSVGLGEISDKINQMTRKMVKENQLQVEHLTESQTVDAIRQMIIAGDFIRHVRVDNHGQTVVYIPGAEVERLRTRVVELEQQVADTFSPAAISLIKDVAEAAENLVDHVQCSDTLLTCALQTWPMWTKLAESVSARRAGF